MRATKAEAASAKVKVETSSFISPYSTERCLANSKIAPELPESVHQNIKVFVCILRGANLQRYTGKLAIVAVYVRCKEDGPNFSSHELKSLTKSHGNNKNGRYFKLQ
jgi:hypothetical protein